MNKKLIGKLAAFALLAGVASVAGLTGCTMDSGPSSSTPATGGGSSSVAAGPTKSVDISTFQFAPGALIVSVGTTVTWTNHDNIGHTVTSGTPDKPGGPLNGTLAGKDTTYSYKFDTAGEYPYFCNVHHGMTGTVTVTP